MKTSRLRSAQSGFTMIEIMLVISIAVVLLAVVAAKLGPMLFVGQSVRADADVNTITGLLRTYEAMNLSPPSEEQGLEALVTKPSGEPNPTRWHQFLQKLPVDPWNNPYKYRVPGSH